MEVEHAVEEQVKKTIQEFRLFSKTDNILVAVSGGKDSTTLLHILHKQGYPVEALTIDVNIGCFTQENLERIKKLCAEKNITLHIRSFKDAYGHSLCHIRDRVSVDTPHTSCAVCGVLRRYLLNKTARELGATVLATGHNLDDEASSILMNVMRNNTEQLAWIGPRTKARSSLFVPRVKPLYMTCEKDVIRYSKAQQFDVTYGACPCSKDAFRSDVKKMMYTLQETYPQCMENIVQYFLARQKTFQQRAGNVSAHTCKECGEPTKRTLCKVCSWLSVARSFEKSHLAL